MLTHKQLLDRAVIESQRLEALVEDYRTELFQMSQHYLRSGWNRGFSDYYAQRREVSTQLLYAEADLVRSQGRERILKSKIASGEVRGLAVVVAA